MRQEAGTQSLPEVPLGAATSPICGGKVLEGPRIRSQLPDGLVKQRGFPALGQKLGDRVTGGVWAHTWQKGAESWRHC